MEEEKIADKIVDEIATKVIGMEYIFPQNNLNNRIKQYDNKEILHLPIKEKNDIVKKFVGKKERKSKVIINNDNIGLYLEQDRSDGTGWNVFIKDLSVDNNPRVEGKKFGNNYKEAERYYGELFFKYQFSEVKKVNDKNKKCKFIGDKEKDILNNVFVEKLNKKKDKKLVLRTEGKIFGENISIVLDNDHDICYEDIIWSVRVQDLDDHWNRSDKKFGLDYDKAKEYFIKLCDDYNLNYNTSEEMEIQYKKAGGIFLVCFIIGFIILVNLFSI